MTQSALALLAGIALAVSVAAEEPVLHSTTFSWEDIQALPAGASGMARAVVRAPTPTLDELEMHVTALPAGKTTHPPHTHPNEEIIIIKEGNVEAYQNGKTRRLGPGSIIFEASNEPHNLTNVGDTTAVYHVINWATPGLLKAKQEESALAIRALYRDWTKAASERGVEGYASYFAEDAVLLPPDGPPVTGRPAIRTWQEQREATYRIVRESVAEDELQITGGAATNRSTLRGKRVTRAGGESVPFEAKFFDVLRRKADGTWEVTHRMWNSNQVR